MMQQPPDSNEPKLDKARHVKYWTRCLKTLLPHHYTGNESNRMYLAFFIISSLDILGAWTSVASDAERSGYLNWIYRCQHPNGGFRMWPGTDFDDRSTPENARWDPANIPATYFALCALVVAGDDLKRVKRRETLQWLKRMQREEGSFGETMVNGRIEGGKDPRFGYCATGVRYILRGDSEGPLEIDGTVTEDIDIDGLVHCLTLAESYDGGMADEAFHEPHAGYTFTALGCLNFVKRLKTAETQGQDKPHAPSDPAATLRWLAERQTYLSDPDNEVDEQIQPTGEDEQKPTATPPSPPVRQTPPLHQSPDKSLALSPFGLDEPPEAGMNGRANKVADTCYGWWAGASFHLLGHPEIYDKVALRRYLLSSTQHPALGGFGKFPGDLPDLYHSNLGLATLGIMGLDDVDDENDDGNGIKAVDPAMCITKEASARLPLLWSSFRETDLARAHREKPDHTALPKPT